MLPGDRRAHGTVTAQLYLFAVPRPVELSDRFAQRASDSGVSLLTYLSRSDHCAGAWSSRVAQRARTLALDAQPLRPEGHCMCPQCDPPAEN
jgi:hypothetical protein